MNIYQFLVSLVVVRLLVPRSEDSKTIRPFDVKASDLDILLEIKPEGKVRPKHLPKHML